MSTHLAYSKYSDVQYSSFFIIATHPKMRATIVDVKHDKNVMKSNDMTKLDMVMNDITENTAMQDIFDMYSLAFISLGDLGTSSFSSLCLRKISLASLKLGSSLTFIFA